MSVCLLPCLARPITGVNCTWFITPIHWTMWVDWWSKLLHSYSKKLIKQINFLVHLLFIQSSWGWRNVPSHFLFFLYRSGLGYLVLFFAPFIWAASIRTPYNVKLRLIKFWISPLLWHIFVGLSCWFSLRQWTVRLSWHVHPVWLRIPMPHFVRNILH